MTAKVGMLASALLLTFSLTGCPTVSPSAVNQPNRSNEKASLQKMDPAPLSPSLEMEYQTTPEQEQSVISSDNTPAPTANITMKINEEEFVLTLTENDTAEAFVDLLPLEAEFSELNGNEKYSYIDQSLPSNGSIVPDIEAGDVMLYGDNCIVIFYEAHSNNAYSYTPIGQIADTSTLASAVGTGAVEVQVLP